jgi:hypothetical protein
MKNRKAYARLGLHFAMLAGVVVLTTGTRLPQKLRKFGEKSTTIHPREIETVLHRCERTKGAQL